MSEPIDTPAAPSARPDWDEASDEQLLAAIAGSGDRTAFVALFGRYAGRIKAFLIRSGASETMAEEAAQEVMIQLWRRAGSFDPGKAKAATWIFTIARNKRIDLIRRDARAAQAPDEPTAEVDPAPAAETVMADQARDAQVREAIAALPPDQLEVVRRAFFVEQSHSDIAAELDLPLGTVKSRLRLAFRRLRDSLGPAFQMELLDD